GDQSDASVSITSRFKDGLSASRRDLGRLLRLRNAFSAIQARRLTRPPSRASSGQTVDGDRTSSLAIVRMLHPLAKPREIVSPSSADSEFARWTRARGCTPPW